MKHLETLYTLDSINFILSIVLSTFILVGLIGLISSLKEIIQNIKNQ